jgi:biotin-(acetyl-CoA carboxylase) ligase
MVRAHTPSGEVTGRAVDIADDGSLVLETDEGLAQISAADVIHLRDA